MKSGLLVVSSVLLALVVGCGKSGGGGSVPTEQAGRQCLQEKFSTPESKVKLLSFHKTNGIDQDTRYILEYEGEVEITANGVWDGQNFYKTDPHLGMYCTPVKAGERRKIEGTVGFSKTENGWRSYGADWRTKE